jgi:hypothetical protein
MNWETAVTTGKANKRLFVEKKKLSLRTTVSLPQPIALMDAVILGAAKDRRPALGLGVAAPLTKPPLQL